MMLEDSSLLQWDLTCGGLPQHGQTGREET